MNDDVRWFVHKAAGASAVVAAALSPIPMADEIALLPVFGVLASRVGRAHGLGFTALPWRAITRTAVSGLTARATLNLSVSFIPGVAAVANAASAIALVEFFGRWVDSACEKPAEAEGVGVKEVVETLRSAVRWKRSEPPAEATAG